MFRYLALISSVATVAATLGKAAETPVAWSLNVPSKPIRAGASFKAALNAIVQTGWHLYALEEPDGGPVATEIAVADSPPFGLGAIHGPKPVELYDVNFGKRVGLYTGKATFELPVTVAANTSGGNHTTSVSVRYQCCNDVMCLPPKTLSLPLTVEVKAAFR